jgi:sulfate adenylyltransferase subunit 2
MNTAPQTLLSNPSAGGHWDTASFHAAWQALDKDTGLRTTERWLKESALLPAPIGLTELVDDRGRGIRNKVASWFDTTQRKKKYLSLVLQLHQSELGPMVLLGTDAKGGRRWIYLTESPSQTELLAALEALIEDRNAILWPSAELHEVFRAVVTDNDGHKVVGAKRQKWLIGLFAFQEPEITRSVTRPLSSHHRGHLDALEAESIHIMREVVAQAQNPVMLYSVGKDSAVMLRLAQKAFAPSKPPFPLLHVDTRWKFQAMYEYRQHIAEDTGMELIRHVNPEGVEKDINPFDHGSELHTHIMKTEGLKQALDQYGFDVAFGGARRDEEKSRAKERVFSFRSESHQWDPKNQRPELWNLYNGYKKPGESIRVFPLSNWTEQDIWEYIYRESIPIVPLYFAKERPMVFQDGTWFLVDDDRFRLDEDDKIELKKVRFRTLGCYPLTGAFESEADRLDDIVLEVLTSRTSERQGRKIDSDSNASMEKKKLEGYF